MNVEDIIEIQQIQALYGHAVDAPDQSLLPQVFTHDAVFDARASGGKDDLYIGITAISEWFALGKPPHPTSHHMTNVWVYEQEGEVRVKAKWFVQIPVTGKIYSGDYNDLMEKTVGGWRIKHRNATLRLDAV